MTIEAFWKKFLAASGLPPETAYKEAFSFETSEYWANELLRLVLAGKKRATSSSLLAYEKEGEALPRPGEFSIVTDWAGEPRCVIETTAVQIIPFNQMTFDIVRREGEDECLETWQAGHRRFFLEDAKQLGYTFTEDMPVVFEDFRVVYPLPMKGTE